MTSRNWNILLKFILSSLTLMAAFYVFDIVKGTNVSDSQGNPFNGTGSATMSGFFLMLGLLVLAGYIPNRAFPGKANYAMLWIVPLVTIVYFSVVSLF